MNQPVNQFVIIKDKLLEIVRTRGPLLPVQITKELGVNVMMASALLSELVDKKTLRLSNTKVGGSPMYYVVGQEAKLQMLRDKLNDKQQKAFDMLKQSKILRDSEQEPVIRLALREIKDFAHQLNVTAEGIQEIFWKWYLMSDKEAEPIIREKFEKLSRKEYSHKETQKDVQKHLSDVENELKKLDKKNVKEEIKNDFRPIEQKVKEEIAKELPKAKEEKLKKGRKKKEEIVQENVIDETDEFMMKVVSYFKQNHIDIHTIKQIKKNNDFESIIKIPTVVGSITYFCKAKNKMKISESDLSLLFAQSQIKKMPILLITPGETTKKAQELLSKEFKNITVKRL